ncbi:ATPase domain-containing protein [Sphingomonas sp. MAHUQ-71]|uniref:ATPase domain-containing protein n=1 Tax=Sphingomonas oryzagri TaxID=3042314 RepID=A0ABT6MZM6_9SPHN|nr:ATPase domain-containing protein [Sphingomonas oryzagri]MDH7638261.1 ATPase domain-containing protein [Sphingomonas oryzagri]
MAERTPKAAIGIEGLDAVLAGGLTRSRVFLLEGNPGTGKTTIATQFLLEGASALLSSDAQCSGR